MADPARHGYPGGESFQDVHDRVVPVLEQLLANHAGQSVLDFVHRTHEAIHTTRFTVEGRENVGRCLAAGDGQGPGVKASYPGRSARSIRHNLVIPAERASARAGTYDHGITCETVVMDPGSRSLCSRARDDGRDWGGRTTYTATGSSPGRGSSRSRRRQRRPGRRRVSTEAIPQTSSSNAP